MTKPTKAEYILKWGQKIVPISEARLLSSDDKRRANAKHSQPTRYKILWCPDGNYHGKDGGFAIVEEL